jgi:large subunit ribosomal protein L13
LQKTFHPKRSELQQDWLLVDAAGENLGRLATQVARRLLGKHKPTFTPGAEVGDHVVVINASKIQVSGKRLDQKFYYRVSGYPSGIKKVSLRDQLANTPERAIRAAVWGMLPHNRYGRKLIGKLKIYRGADHPHAAQQPVEVVLESKKVAQ